MPINITCTNCHTPYRLGDEMAGLVVTCSRCKNRMQVPGTASDIVDLDARFNRVLGRPAPLFLDILGIYSRWGEEFSNRDLMRLVWSIRHVFLFFLALVFYVHFSDDAENASFGAPLFFWIGLATLVISWIQMDRIAGKQGGRFTGRRSAGGLPRFLSAILLVSTDVRASLPALRTLVLGLVLMLAGLRLVSIAGSWQCVLPLPSFNFGQKSSAPYHPPAKEVPVETPKAAPPPPPPPPEDKPLPPPEDDPAMK